MGTKPCLKLLNYYNQEQNKSLSNTMKKKKEVYTNA